MGHAIADCDGGQPQATGKYVASDTSDAVWNRDAGQIAATEECPAPDVGDTVGNRDASQIKTIGECAIPDAGDRQKICLREIDDAGNVHSAAGTDISRDGNRAVVGYECKWIWNQWGPQRSRKTTEC